jgi:hypothetical protein
MYQTFNLLFGFILVLSFFSFERQCWAAACCARNSATPSLIVGDDEAQINFGVAFGNSVARTMSNGVTVFNPSNVSDMSRNFRIDGAMLLSDRLQVGAGGSVVQREVVHAATAESAIGIGDARMSVAYEILPIWNYSSWKPQAYLFSGVTLPSGRSIYESQNNTRSDVTGNGFYTFSLGSLWIKRWTVWDVFLLPEIHYSLSRTFDYFGDSIGVSPGLGGSVGLGFGFSPGGGNTRLGLRVQPRMDQPRSFSDQALMPSEQSHAMSCDVGLDLSYLLGTTDTMMLSYTDQTWVGPSKNTNLTRNFALSFQHRWER